MWMLRQETGANVLIGDLAIVIALAYFAVRVDLAHSRLSSFLHSAVTSCEGEQTDDEKVRELALLAIVWSLLDRCLIPRLHDEAMDILHAKIHIPRLQNEAMSQLDQDRPYKASDDKIKSDCLLTSL